MPGFAALQQLNIGVEIGEVKRFLRNATSKGAKHHVIDLTIFFNPLDCNATSFLA
jgi:hypothetical protein